MLHKSLILGTLAILLGPIGLCLAQPADDPPPPPRGPHGPGPGPGVGGPKFILNMYDRVTRQLPDQLDLSVEQMDKYKAIVKERRKALEDIVKKLEQERTKFESELNGILTPEQQQKLKDLKAAREKAIKGMQGPQKGPGQGDRQWVLAKAIKELNLPPEKNEQIEKILAEGREKFQAAPKGDREAHRTIMKETMQKVRNVLSPEEAERLRTIMREERRKGGMGPGMGPGRGQGRFGGPGNHPGRGPGGPGDEAAPPPAEDEGLW